MVPSICTVYNSEHMNHWVHVRRLFSRKPSNYAEAPAVILQRSESSSLADRRTTIEESERSEPHPKNAQCDEECMPVGNQSRDELPTSPLPRRRAVAMVQACQDASSQDVYSDLERNRAVKIVAISGRMNAGKDTLARLIQEELLRRDPSLDGKFHKLTFAAPVRNLICELFKVDGEFIDRWKRNPRAPVGMRRSMRELLQHVGDLRTFVPNLWVNAFCASLPEDGWVFVTDVRHRNELKMLHRMGATNIMITRSYRDVHAFDLEPATRYTSIDPTTFEDQCSVSSVATVPTILATHTTMPTTPMAPSSSADSVDPALHSSECELQEVRDRLLAIHASRQPASIARDEWMMRPTLCTPSIEEWSRTRTSEHGESLNPHMHVLVINEASTVEEKGLATLRALAVRIVETHLTEQAVECG